MNILWLDLETSGLDPNRDAILEIACRIAPFENPFESEYLYDQVLSAGGNELRMDGFVWDMHTKNGLLEALKASKTTVQEAERQLLDVVPEYFDKERRWVVGGSTIHFDTGFLRVHMPTLYARLSYRLYDVSAIKLFCRSLGMPKPPKAEAHRAMADVQESIRHAEDCAVWLSEYTMPEAD